MVPNSLALLLQGLFFTFPENHMFLYLPRCWLRTLPFSPCFVSEQAEVVWSCSVKNKISDELKMKTFIELIIINADNKLLFLPEPTDFHICFSILWNALPRVITHIHFKIHTEISYCHSFLLLSTCSVVFWDHRIAPVYQKFLDSISSFQQLTTKTTVAKFSAYLLANKLNFPTYILFYFYLHYKERSLLRVFHAPTKILHDQLSRNVTKKSSSTGPPSEKYLLFFIISTFLSCLLWRH